MSVLVVDDDRDLVDVITYILRRDGIEVTAAFDGQQAWERFQSEAPELVVLDITMPSMDGVELLRRMRDGVDGAGGDADGPPGRAEHCGGTGHRRRRLHH